MNKISERIFLSLMSKYEAEQEPLLAQLKICEEIQEETDDKEMMARKFLSLADKYTDFSELTIPMLNEFIDKIVIHERVKGARYQTYQEIEIYFNFIGQFQIPVEETAEETPGENVTEEPEKRYVANTSSFLSLQTYLEESGESIELTFSEIEKVIGKELCKSAYKHRAYWYPSHNRPIGNIIYNAGYDIEKLDLKAPSMQ